MKVFWINESSCPFTLASQQLIVLLGEQTTGKERTSSRRQKMIKRSEEVLYLDAVARLTFEDLEKQTPHMGRRVGTRRQIS